MLEDWRINDRIRLRKNPHYWNAKNVALESVEALPISVATVAFNFFAGGLADLIVDKNLTPNALLDELEEDAGLSFRAIRGHLFSALQLFKATVQRPARAPRFCHGRGQAQNR